MRLQAFVPRSESMFVFSAVMACYAYFLGGLMNAVIRTFHGAVHPVSLLPDSLYWFTIVIDALLMVTIFEVLRWLRASASIQVILVSVLLAFSRTLSDPLWSLLVLPIYALCALSYVYWRGLGFWKAFCVILLIQAFYDIVPAFRAIFPAMPNA